MTSRREESLFVSLLSPNNAHSVSDEDLVASNDTNTDVMPQVSFYVQLINKKNVLYYMKK